MIHLVDQALERFLRAAVPLPEAAVDVSFVAPDRTWGNSISRPSVNLFLWDVKRSAPLGKAGRIEQMIDGKVVRRQPLPIVDLNYYVTAWASDESDEHQLLGSVLTTILATAILPAEFLPAPLDGLAPATIEVATSEMRKPGDFVSVLDGQLKPGIEMRVSIEVDAHRWVPAGPPTDTVEFGVKPTPKTAPPEPEPKAVRRQRRNGSTMIERASDDAPAPS